MNTYNELTDEELVLSIRLGEPMAYPVLTERFFGMRQYAGKHVAPQWMEVIDPWKYNEVFFTAFLNAVETYQFRKSRLLTYYYRILAREITAVGERIQRERQLTCSLDEPIGPSDDEGFTLHDVIPSDETRDDPSSFFQYSESLEKLNRLPSKLSEHAMQVVRMRMQGFTFREICEHLHILPGKARYAIKSYINWAVKTFTNIYNLDEAQQEEKRKLLERYFRGEGGVGVD